MNKKISKQKGDIIIIQTLIPLFVSLSIEFFFTILNGATLLSNNALFFSILIIYLIYGFLISITSKLSISTIIIAIMGLLLLVVNQIKIEYMGEPIYFSDISFIPNINSIFNMLQGNLTTIMIKYIFTFCVLIGILVLIIKLSKKNEMKLTNIKIKLKLCCICTTIFIFLFIPNKFTKNIFLNAFLNTNGHKDYESYTTNLSYYTCNSLFAGMYGVLLNSRFYEPKNYNETQLEEILEYSGKIDKSNLWKQPNIIVLFSESFWDIDKQNDVIFNKEVTPNIKKLSEKGKLIEVLSCSYGGMSENVAFEFLTGGSLNYFNKGYIPVMSLYKRNNSEQIPSIVKELKANNYKTKIAFGKDYYNSEKTMKKMGFDEYINVDNTNTSDKYMVDLIINELKKQKTSEKIFYMTETIQNHMPYNIEKYENYDISIKESKLKDEENNIILSYAQGIYDADEQLKRLYDYIQNYEEPTILIFLGDHLPYLYTNDGKNVLESISYFNTGNSIEDTYRKYNTQALIVSNYEIDTGSMPNYLSNNLLLTYVVNQMDIELSNYYKFLYTTTEVLPATNSYISLDVKGGKYNTKELTKNMKTVSELRENMQYKFFIK